MIIGMYGSLDRQKQMIRNAKESPLLLDLEGFINSGQKLRSNKDEPHSPGFVMERGRIASDSSMHGKSQQLVSPLITARSGQQKHVRFAENAASQANTITMHKSNDETNTNDPDECCDDPFGNEKCVCFIVILALSVIIFVILLVSQ